MTSPTLRLLTPLLVLPLTGCMMNLSHTRQEKQEPSAEQQLDLYTTTATFLYDDDSLDRAQGQAVKALKIDPDHRAMRRMIGWIRLRLGTNEDLFVAEDFFRALRADGDDNAATLLGYGMTLERLGSAYSGAAERVRKGKQVPAMGRTAEEEARDLARKGIENWRHAIALYDESLTEGEGSTTAMNGLQRVHALLGELEESLAWSSRLLERSSEELAIWRRMLTQTDMTSTEEALFRENERISDQLQFETHLFASTVLNRLGRTEEAIAHLDAVVDTRPELPQGYSLRAQLLAKRGDYELAVRDLDRFLGLSDQPFGAEEIRQAFDMRAEFARELEQAKYE